ncbi:NmrA/HSCARG family protein [Negadavirga shengliensis]|uniref:NmrA/HSCARG family protein n=1 Tax=Negadavirga shengliensis TaxID=1389218 RepID=A0ABV9SYP2_9BACT
MSNKKIIVIFGATGSQGGGLAKAMLDDPRSEFEVRAVTRDPQSEKSRELAQKGAEIVKADVDDINSIKKALEGAYGAYFVTFYWEHFSPEKELGHIKNMAEAASETGIRHAIWSTLEDSRKWIPLDDDRMPTLQDKYKVPHFDVKGEGDQFFTNLKVPTTFLRTTFYWDNFIYFGSGPQKGPDGNLYLTFPIDDKKLCGIAAEDIGKCAYGIFKQGNALIGKTIGIAGEALTGEEMAAAMSKILGKEIHFNNVSPATFRSFNFPGADDLGNMFQFYRDFDDWFIKSRDLAFAKQLNPDLLSFEDWLKKYGKLIPLD